MINSIKMKIIDYTVIKANNLSSLRVNMNEYLKKGRQPY